MDFKPATLIKISVFTVLSSCVVAYASTDPEYVSGLLNQALSHQVTQFTVAFTIAAWLHSGRVKKEIKNQLGSISVSIDGVAQTLRQDLQAQNKRLASVETEVKNISGRVGVLEQNKP